MERFLKPHIAANPLMERHIAVSAWALARPCPQHVSRCPQSLIMGVTMLHADVLSRDELYSWPALSGVGDWLGSSRSLSGTNICVGVSIAKLLHAKRGPVSLFRRLGDMNSCYWIMWWVFRTSVRLFVPTTEIPFFYLPCDHYYQKVMENLILIPI